MLAARDQENFAHGLQAAAATKPLNQGLRQYAPKTPANKPTKTPSKIPLNDENGSAGLHGRTGLKGKENVTIIGKKGGVSHKNAFVTPMETRSRAPLGAKTTNARAKPLQTPGLEVIQTVIEKPGQKSASARKLKPKVAHAELTKLEVHGDEDILAEREIEYMPPRVQALPDFQDDELEPNLSVLRNGRLAPGDIAHFRNVVDPADGLSAAQRVERAREKRWDIQGRKEEAMHLYKIECANVPCTHMRDCSGDECSDNIEARKQAKQKLDMTIAALDPKSTTSTKSASKSITTIKGPNESTSKRAATVLAQPKPHSTTTKALPLRSAPAKSAFPASLLSSRKQTPRPAPPLPISNATSSTQRHVSAIAYSRTTLGYSKGRATSASIRKTVLPAAQTIDRRQRSVTSVVGGARLPSVSAGFAPSLGGVENGNGNQAAKRDEVARGEQMKKKRAEQQQEEKEGREEEEVEEEEEEEQREGFEQKVDRIFRDQAEEEFVLVW